MRPPWQLCLSELLQDVISYCIMPAARSPELSVFHSIVIMSSWLVQLRVFTALFCVVYRREMLDTPVNMDNVYSVTPAVTHLSYSRLDMVSIRNDIIVVCRYRRQYPITIAVAVQL